MIMMMSMLMLMMMMWEIVVANAVHTHTHSSESWPYRFSYINFQMKFSSTFYAKCLFCIPINATKRKCEGKRRRRWWCKETMPSFLTNFKWKWTINKRLVSALLFLQSNYEIKERRTGQSSKGGDTHSHTHTNRSGKKSRVTTTLTLTSTSTSTTAKKSIERTRRNTLSSDDDERQMIIIMLLVNEPFFVALSLARTQFFNSIVSMELCA